MGLFGKERVFYIYSTSDTLVYNKNYKMFESSKFVTRLEIIHPIDVPRLQVFLGKILCQ